MDDLFPDIDTKKSKDCKKNDNMSVSREASNPPSGGRDEATVNAGLADRSDLTDLKALIDSDDGDSGTTPTRGSAAPRGGGGGRGGGITRSRSGPTRAAKHRRPQRQNRDSDDDDSDEPTKTKKRQKPSKPAAATPEILPFEIHRRKTSLRDRLIKGEYTPQAVGMRAYKLKQAALAANTPPAAASPTEARNPMATPYSLTTRATLPIRPMAYKSTPVTQLYFPADLFEQLKVTDQAWDAEENTDGRAFIAIRLVAGDVVDIKIHNTLRNANADALAMILNEHPEVFTMPLPGSPHQLIQANTVIRHLQTPTTGVHHNNNNNNNNNNANEEKKPTYVFSGTYAVSFCKLKMETQRPDGATIKVSVHIGDLPEKPEAEDTD